VDPRTSEVKHLWRDIYIPILAWTLFALKKSFPVQKRNSRSKPQRSAHTTAFVPTDEIFSQQLEWSLGAFAELRGAFAHLEMENAEVSQLTWPGWDDSEDTLVIVPNPTPFPHTGTLCSAITPQLY
jgi:hypothetical protein